MVAHDSGRLVHQRRNLVVALAVLDDLSEKLDIVAPASLDELLLDRCALRDKVRDVEASQHRVGARHTSCS
jgi:hypothetical protein